jgi:hypothetical protein
LNISANVNRPGGGHGSESAEAGDTNVVIRLGVSSGSGYAAAGGRKISGRILDPEGKPAAKVRVYLFPHSSGERQTDGEGKFTITSNPQRFGGMENPQEVLLARDVTRNLAAAMELEDNATNAELKLAPGLTLAGRVLDVAGKPISNAQVQMVFWTERMGSWVGTPARCDAEGNYEVNALPPGRRYGLNASAKGYGQDSRTIETPETDSGTTKVEPFELQVADQRIAGVVVDSDDKPVARAHIYTYGQKQPNLNAQTDNKGQFAFSNVCSGPIQVSASANRGYANATVQAGDTNVTIRLGASGGSRRPAPLVARLKGKQLPEVAPLGLSAADCPENKPILVALIDAEQRPSRRALRLLSEQAPALREKGVTVLVVQAAPMAEDAFNSWKSEAALPFAAGRMKEAVEKQKATWGAQALPWLILADKDHRVAAEGFPVEELEANLGAIK